MFEWAVMGRLVRQLLGQLVDLDVGGCGKAVKLLKQRLIFAPQCSRSRPQLLVLFLQLGHFCLQVAHLWLMPHHCAIRGRYRVSVPPLLPTDLTQQHHDLPVQNLVYLIHVASQLAQLLLHFPLQQLYFAGVDLRVGDFDCEGVEVPGQRHYLPRGVFDLPDLVLGASVEHSLPALLIHGDIISMASGVSYVQIIVAVMKRPQSAKPGHRGFWGHGTTDEAAPEMHPKMVKFMRPDLTTHDFARILPRRFHHDKERLYSEALQLKQHLNETIQENTKLKTRISVLEREKGRAVRFDTAPSETNQRRPVKQQEKPMLQGIKKLLRQSRDECQALKAENAKIKKTVKYTRINELEIEKKILADENSRLSGVLEELASRLSQQQQLESDNQQLSQALEDEVSMRERAEDAAQQLQQQMEDIQHQMDSEKQKLSAKVKKMQRDIQTENRKVNEYQRQLGQAKRQLNAYKEGNLANSQKKQLRPSSRPHPNRTKKVYTQHSESRDINSSQLSVDTTTKYEKQALESEVRTLKMELAKAQEQITVLNQEKWELSKATPVQQAPQDEYDIEQFEGVEEQPEQDSRVAELQEEMQAEGEQEALVQAAPTKSASKKKKTKSGKKEKSQRKGSSTHDRKALTQIKQLLTYRMKSQRYPFGDLKSDIECSSITHFSQADLRTMLINQPFYLTPAYTQVILRFLLGQGNETQGLGVEALVGKLRGLIGDFELSGEEQEKQMILRVAEMTSTYPRELQVAFQNIRNGPQTVSKQDLTDMFLKLELQEKYIELIIAELSLCSDDLQHLNFHGFFQRFYIEQADTGPEAIEQIRQESEESHKPSSRNLKGSSSLSPEHSSPQ